MANLDSRIVVEGDKLFKEFRGAFTENYVLNIILHNTPKYFNFDWHKIVKKLAQLCK